MVASHLLIVTALVVTSQSRLVQDVCSIPQWEGQQTTLRGESRDGHSGVTLEVMSISYDYNNSRIATSTNRTEDGRTVEVKQIFDYRRGVLYHMVEQDCDVIPLHTNFSKACVPEDANYSWDKTHYGIDHDDMLIINEYRGREDDLNYIVHATYMGNPVMQVVYGEIGGADLFSNTAFTNMTVGIKDTTIFTPPSNCHERSQHVLSSTTVRNHLFMAFL